MLENAFAWFMDKLFGWFLVLAIVVLVLFGCVLSTGPYNYSVSVPTDVCPGQQVRTNIQDSTLRMDYVNLNGDTVYLVYQAGRAFFVPSFKSQQIVAGPGCDQ